MIFHTTALSAAIETIGCDMKGIVFVIETVFEFMFVFFVEAVPLVTTALPVAVEAIKCVIKVIGFSVNKAVPLVTTALARFC